VRQRAAAPRPPRAARRAQIIRLFYTSCDFARLRTRLTTRNRLPSAMSDFLAVPCNAVQRRV
ncbi:hypothetical protein, partial [Burkholderia multivorans]|uniref:hypothetical protein n=1 Tax=Burkholderia multivorans TaxID=87883 RepID=UPI0021C0E755